MLSHVSIICFAASYAIVLAMEISRLLFHSKIRGAFLVGWAWAGLFAHSIFLYYRAVNTIGVPLSSWQDWFLVAAWALMVAYLHLLYFHPQTSIGLFIMPIVLALIGVAAFVASPEPFAREPASKIWGAIHGSSLAAAVVAMLVGFAAGVMYIWQIRRLKQKLPVGQGLRLPSLEWLQRINHRAIVIALIMLGIGVLGGMILNSINHSPQQERLPWNDPLVLSTIIMFFCLLAAVGVSQIFMTTRRGRKVAYLTLVCFMFLVAALIAGLFLNTQHGGRRIHDGSINQEQKLNNR
jgi:ABC-type transport system involved in cytochrome c biogenesis permease subunit